MKKLILATLLTYPFIAVSSIDVGNSFHYTSLTPPAIHEGRYTLKSTERGVLYSGTAKWCNIQGTSLRCSFFANHTDRQYMDWVYASDHTLITSCPDKGFYVGYANIRYGNQTGQIEFNSQNTGKYPINTKLGYDLEITEFNVVVGEFPLTASSAVCNIYLDGTEYGKRLIGQLLLNTDLASGDTGYGLEVSPATLSLQGEPSWRGTVQIRGRGYASRLLIESNHDVTIDLGAGASRPGRAFSSKLTQGSAPVEYSGTMAISGIVSSTGSTLYNIRLTQVLD